MVIVFETLDMAAVEPLLLGMPESFGVLLFGIGLVTIAMLLRWILGRGDDEKGEDEIG